MRTSPLTCSLALLALLLSAGCGPSAPTEADGRAAYAAAEARVRAVQDDLEQALAAVPHFGLPTEELPCTPAGPGLDTPTDMAGLVAEAHCLAQRSDMLEARTEALGELAGEGLASLVSKHDLVGIEVTWTVDGDPANHLAGRVGGSPPPGRRNDAVRAEDGVTVGERHLGWGLYQDAAADHAYRSGIELLWTWRHARADVQARVVLWAAP